MRGRPITRSRRWALRSAAAALALLAVFAVLEVGLRLKGGAPSLQPLFMNDTAIGYRPRPGAHMRYTTSEFSTDLRINPVGVRDEDFGTKALNERRIIVLGDSMVMAIQVPLRETFVKRLEQHLNAHSSVIRYRVINAGVQGYGTVEQYLFLKKMIDLLQPDLVVLAVFVGNDAVEAADAAWRLSPAAPSRSEQLADNLWRWMRRVARRSAAVQFVRQNFPAAAALSREAPVRQRPLDSYLEPAPREVQEGFVVAGACVTRIAALAQSRGAPTAVVLLPARFQINDTDFANLNGVLSRSGRTLLRDAATSRFHAVLEGSGLPVLDVLPVFRGASQRDSLYFQQNVHLTARGHQLLADALVQFLLAQSLVPFPNLNRDF